MIFCCCFLVCLTHLLLSKYLFMHIYTFFANLFEYMPRGFTVEVLQSNELFQVRSPEVLSFCTHHILKCTDSYFLWMPHHDKMIASLVLYFSFFNCLCEWGHKISCNFLLAQCGYATRLILLSVLLIKCDTWYSIIYSCLVRRPH